MKGNEKLLTVLNQLLADELTAISQYMVHSEVCDSWGYSRLHKAIEKQAVDEMHHAESLIQRILFLQGAPVVSKLNAMRFGTNVPEIISYDQEAELAAVSAYNAAIGSARGVGDQATAELLTTILKDEEAHLGWGETQQSQIEQMGLASYLANQAEGE